ncbi:MAG: hypothetical protein DRJ64_02585 [Thermoprotei archaeon]|nr:MAG: hypothetical protein DRJ64_02585 [Thermoprotei archaeon]
MLTAIIDSLLSRREEILGKLNVLMKQGDESALEDLNWRNFQQGKVQDFPIAAVDGSMNYKLYKGFIIYAVGSEGVLLDNDRISDVKQLGDVDVLIPFWLPEERIKLYMSILEMKNAIYMLVKNSRAFVLIDGSLSNLIMRPIRYVYSNTEINRKIEEEYFETLQDDIEKLRNSIVSKNYTQEVFERYKDEYGVSEAQAACFYLEYIEYLLSLRCLLSKYSERIISVAKNSEDRSIFKLAISDIAYLDVITKTPGFTQGENIVIKTIKRKLPVFWDFFKNLEFTVIYVRFSRGGPMLKLEIPYTLRSLSIVDILKTLQYTCVDGYPYPLMKAHRDVKITNKDMEAITKMLSVYWAKTGREML